MRTYTKYSSMLAGGSYADVVLAHHEAVCHRVLAALHLAGIVVVGAPKPHVVAHDVAGVHLDHGARRDGSLIGPAWGWQKQNF